MIKQVHQGRVVERGIEIDEAMQTVMMQLWFRITK